MSDIYDYYQAYYSKAGENGKDGYRMEKWKDTSRVLFLKQYIAQLTPKSGKVLDIGCGDMYLASLLPDYQWTGIDAANEYSKGRAIVHDLMALPYPVEANSQDTVMCSEVLEHLWEPQKVHFEAFRTLKPGGHYVISTPNFDNLSWVMDHGRDMLFKGIRSDHYEHIRWYNYDVHKTLLEQAGFQVIGHVGADAHGVDFFQKARAVLFYFFRDNLKIEMSEGQVDQLLGQMFSKHCATIMLIARKPN